MKKEYLTLVIFLLISILLLFANSIPPVKFITGFVQNIFAPPRTALYGFKVYVAEDKSAENKKLRDENAALIKKISDYERLRKDNEALRGQFETQQTQNLKLIPAEVIGFVGSNTSPQAIIINVGEKTGIKSGEAVVLSNNLVGKIEKSFVNYSRVTIVKNAAFSTLAYTSENNSEGIIKGETDFILLDNVSVNNKVNQGETVFSRGDINEEGIGVPAGIVIGKISAVSKRESLPFQTAKVESGLDFAHLSKVFVVAGLK